MGGEAIDIRLQLFGKQPYMIFIADSVMHLNGEGESTLNATCFS